MSRILKRVPMNFDYPFNKVWEGYMNPYPPKKCGNCNGSGYNKATKELSDSWYSKYTFSPQKGPVLLKEGWMYNLDEYDIKALIDAGRLYDFTRVPINEEQEKIVSNRLKNGEGCYLPFFNGYTPTPQEVNEWARKGMGHNSVNQYICVKEKAKRLGIYGFCPICHAKGEIYESEEIENLHDSWKEYEPPIGEGYQLWENTSLGSPISPVFSTLDQLCEWAEINQSIFANIKITKEEWKQELI